MSGLTKECKVCGKSFTTMSLKSTEFEERCESCNNTKWRTTAEKNIVGKLDRAVMSIETRLDRLENSQEMIPMLVGAEVSTAMLDINKLTGLNITEIISFEIDKATEKYLATQKQEIKLFKTKLQTQILTLNNKIIKLIQEMEQ